MSWVAARSDCSHCLRTASAPESIQESMIMRTADPVQTEIALQKMVAVFIVTGLVFLVLPGTFLGVWNLVSISSRHALGNLSPAWLQAHGHAQIFGWLGTFI